MRTKRLPRNVWAYIEELRKKADPKDFELFDDNIDSVLYHIELPDWFNKGNVINDLPREKKRLLVKALEDIVYGVEDADAKEVQDIKRRAGLSNS